MGCIAAFTYLALVAKRHATNSNGAYQSIDFLLSTADNLMRSLYDGYCCDDTAVLTFPSMAREVGLLSMS